MCIIVVKPEGKIIPVEQYRFMWDSNPHGAGFMYAEDGELHVVKGLMTFKAFQKALAKVGEDRKMVIHFRWRTHGPTNKAMTHPFWVVDGKFAMAHNGTIKTVVEETTDYLSDTAVFAKKLAQGYTNPVSALQHPFHRDMITNYIGYSRMVFMDNTGEIVILNQQNGEWNDGVWYSNDMHRQPRTFNQGTYSIPSPPMNWATYMSKAVPGDKHIPAKGKKVQSPTELNPRTWEGTPRLQASFKTIPE